MGFLEELQTRIVPGDGAMGTTLLDAGIAPGVCLEELCVSQPDLVASTHERFIAAGAAVIRTNSFGANAVRLARHGFDRRVNELNWTAARLGRDAVRGKSVFVAGSVGPLGITAEQAAEQGIDRRAVFQEQIGALLDGGVDMIFLETFPDLDELALALDIKHTLHHCPVVCSLFCPATGVLPSGMTVTEAISRLIDRGADLAGVNCVPPEEAIRLLGMAPDGAWLSAFPSAGLPNERDGRWVYPVGPDEFAETALQLAGLGVRFLGGCCGASPEHIAALVGSLKKLAESVHSH